MAEPVAENPDVVGDLGGYVRLAGGPYHGKVIRWDGDAAIYMPPVPPLFGKAPPRPPVEGKMDLRLHQYEQSKTRPTTYLYKGFK